MRLKNFTLLFLMGIFGLFSFNAQAQQDASIDPSEILYWVGEGENEAVFIVNWNEPDTALAWGYRFAAETVTVKEMMDDIAAADHRFAYDAPSSLVNDITFSDGYFDLALTEDAYWMYNVNGEMAMEYFDTQVVANGDYVKWGDTNCGTMIDPANWIYVWEMTVTPVYPLADEAMIDASEILYWVGQGQNEVIFCVNWAEPNKALAWGYRFDTNDVILKVVMDAIAAADPRFDYVASGGYITDITFNEGELNLGLVGPYFMYNLNGSMAWYGYEEQTVVNGDFVKFGDISCATDLGHWTYVWETPVEPVTAYNATDEYQDAVLSVYPNPASSYAMLSLEGMRSNSVVTVTDLQGRVLSTFAVNHADEPVRIETEGLEAGIYFVTVNDGANRQTVKLSVR